MSAPEPAWLLLAWAAVAATLGAALVGAAPGTATLLPAAAGSAAGRRRVRTVLVAFLVGILFYPMLYGVGFELLERADLGVGAGFGAAHGLLALVARALRRRPAASPTIFRLLAARLLYGAIIGFLYVVPSPPAA